MEDLHLSETLQRYFSDVFLCCDEDKSGKAPIPKTLELLKSGNIPDEVISQISDICWTPGTTYLNRKQFFSALKLAAAYRANIPLCGELVSLKLELPLPHFTWSSLESKSPIADLIELRNENEFTDTSTSTDSEADSETVRFSPTVSSPASDSPTPTNSVQDRSWVVSKAWQGLVSEEQRQLLGTEEESSDRHSSEEDAEVSSEVWTITPEQREYYTEQFKKLQDNTNALLAGPVARTFFERSQLPVHELRKIWQLADVTRDGALSLQEFNTAMHLVVIRKHNIMIPDVLPPSLVPRNETPPSVSPETEPILSPQTKDTAKEWTKFVESPTSSVPSPGPKPVNFDFQIDQNDPDIRHPVARRLTPEVAAAVAQQQPEDQVDARESPKRVEENNVAGIMPNLCSNNQRTAIQRPQPKKINVPGPGAIPPPPMSQLSNEETGPVSLPAFPPPKKEKPPPPPPRPFKTHGRSSSLDLNRLSKLGAPPVVPPRVSPNNQSKKFVTQQSEGGTEAIDSTESGTPFANFTQFEKYENEGIFPGETYEADRRRLFKQLFAEEPAEPRRHGAFEVYRKPNSRGPSSSRESPVDAAEDDAKWREFKKLQLENAALLRTCQELSQTLADLQEEKMKLRVRLEQLDEEENGA